MTQSPSDIETVRDMVSEIGTILHGKGPAIQGAVLADLLAMWLAGHVAGEDTEEIRRDLLESHIKVVRELIPENEKVILDNLPRQS